jgi:hypothetical protein
MAHGTELHVHGADGMAGCRTLADLTEQHVGFLVHSHRFGRGVQPVNPNTVDMPRNPVILPSKLP